MISDKYKNIIELNSFGEIKVDGKYMNVSKKGTEVERWVCLFADYRAGFGGENLYALIKKDDELMIVGFYGSYLSRGMGRMEKLHLEQKNNINVYAKLLSCNEEWLSDIYKITKSKCREDINPLLFSDDNIVRECAREALINIKEEII